MATNSSLLAWRIPGTAEPGRLPSMGSHRVEHNWSNLAAAAATPFQEAHLWRAGARINVILKKLGLISQFSRSVTSNSLWPHEPQHTRPPCPSTTPRVHPNPHPLSWWRHPDISSSVIPFSSCPQSFQASGSFPMSYFFTSGGQRIGVSASASVLPMNIQDWFPLGRTEASPTPQFKSFKSSALSFLYSPILTFVHDSWRKHNLD